MGSAEQPTKAEDPDLLEGVGEGLLQALEGVGAGARQLAGQVIGQAVVTKTDEPVPDPEHSTLTRATTMRTTRSLRDILAERRCHEEEEDALEEQEELEGRGLVQEALDRYEREMEAAQLSRKRTQEEKEKEKRTEELEAKKLKRSERHHRRREQADEEYQKEEEKRRKDKEEREESERVRKQQDALLRKAQTLVQREKNRPGKSAVIAVGEEEGGDEDMWLPDVVISRKDKEKVTKFRHKKPAVTKPQEEEGDDEDVEEEEEIDDGNGDWTGIDMNDPDIIKLAGCMHAKNIKTAQAYEHYMRGIANSILDKVGESVDVPKYYHSVVKSMWSVAQNMRMYKFIKDADLQAVYKAIPDMKCVALRNRMEGKRREQQRRSRLNLRKWSRYRSPEKIGGACR